VGSTESFDLVVIGCGPAGEKAGAQAAYFGKRAAIIERAPHMGGSCAAVDGLALQKPVLHSTIVATFR
jgi:NAD(P) transhydrogenase